ncbi:peptidoglycan peptidase [Leptospira perolatii]|uniref:Peptidoglycan peptidase n=1 Tax=Leptospira perolatii TaxID=2023191 RepID=A0A2M9ZJ42_9LEPT|nr:YiiX family permuted papain-like enzyme [Leptospira perolatii]PJZ68647.1 peptidoglycan peptidase [Leptospira perolatii]PJZ71994.1 peptidoglycan peptidase [Leptospira perolatii]
MNQDKKHTPQFKTLFCLTLYQGLNYRFRTAFLALLLFFSLSLVFNVQASSLDPSILKEGDIIFHESLSKQSKALKLATKSRYTHIGILFRFGQELKVLEAVEPVRITELESFIARGKNRHFVIKRLNNFDQHLSDQKIQKMKDYGRSFLGRHYDPFFEWSDERIYCTELVWKIYKKIIGVELGPLSHLSDFDLSDPFVQKMMKARYGSKIPYHENVMSPSDMFKSELLVTVIEKN